MAINSTQITQLEKQRTLTSTSWMQKSHESGSIFCRRMPTCSTQVKRAFPARPCMTDFSLKAVRRKISVRQEVIAESPVLPQITPRPLMDTSQKGKSYTAKSRFWRRYTKRRKRVYVDQWLIAQCILPGVDTQSACSTGRSDALFEPRSGRYLILVFVRAIGLPEVSGLRGCTDSYTHPLCSISS